MNSTIYSTIQMNIIIDSMFKNSQSKNTILKLFFGKSILKPYDTQLRCSYLKSKVYQKMYLYEVLTVYFLL